eukprot:369384-Rhodomonas_salina.1
MVQTQGAAVSERSATDLLEHLGLFLGEVDARGKTHVHAHKQRPPELRVVGQRQPLPRHPATAHSKPHRVRRHGRVVCARGMSSRERTVAEEEELGEEKGGRLRDGQRIFG